MKRCLYMILILALAAGIFTGCGDNTTSGDDENQNTATNGQNAKAGEQDANENFYLYIKKNSWDSVTWDNVKDPHLAFLTIIKEIGEIPVTEDGSFNIEFSGLLYEDDKATVSVNKLNVTGKVENIKSLTDTADNTVVGSGSVSVELHYNIDESDWARPHIIDEYIKVDSDVEITSQKSGEIFEVVSTKVLQSSGNYNYSDNGQKEDFNKELEYFFSLKLSVLNKG